MDNTSSISSVEDAQGMRITSLKHALALIRGEMGSQASDTPYSTVHGGIRGVWAGLQDLKAGLDKQTIAMDSKAEGSRVDKLLVETSVAWLEARAMRPCRQWNS